MNAKIICYNIKYCFDYEIRYVHNHEINLLPNFYLRDLMPEVEPVYNREQKNDIAGPFVEETLTIDIKNDTSYELTKLFDIPVVLQIKTNNGNMVIGSKIYPCSIEISDNGKFTQIVFTCKNHL